jgi:Heparinase II/III-like protein/Heparinase II/III N-terminus
MSIRSAFRADIASSARSTTNAIVTPALHKRWSRLVHMSWGELHTRVGQEASKRLELTKYRFGLELGQNGLILGEKADQRSFFFTAQQLRERTTMLQTHLSSEVKEIVREADDILHHRFRLLGYENVEYGSEIDWHLDAINRKRAPLRPWFKIRFLDFSEVGDHKVIWELNRHQHLVTLAKAWLFTRRDEYVDELIRQWYGWQVANPYPMGINWASSLEIAFRSLSWLWIRHLLPDCPLVKPSFEMDLARGLALNAQHIERYLSTYFSPNTHLLGEAVALFFIGTLYPQLEFAARWRDHGWHVLLAEAQRQVHPDGVYFEQSLYYHVYALDFFLHARLLAAGNQFDVPAAFDVVLEKMLSVVWAVSQTGPPDGFGDDDGGRVFNPRRNRSEHLTDPLALGALLFGRDDLKCKAPLTEEAVWLCGEPAISSLTQTNCDDQKLASVAFESGGIYVMASSEPYAGQMIIDAGPQGNPNSGHRHADALAVRASLDGCRWLVDAGTYSYAGDARDFFRGTGTHNTLRVDRSDQAVPAGPFAWNSIPKVDADAWIPGRTFSLFAGSHNGYARLLDPVCHRRFVFHLHEGFWLVRDFAEGRESHDLETFWHFASGLTATRRESGFIVARPQDAQAQPRVCLGLLPVEDSSWSTDLSSGYVSPAYGRQDSAPVVRCSARVRLPAEHAMLLKSMPPFEKFGRFVNSSVPDGAAQAYRYNESGKSHSIIFAKPRAESWSWCKLTSDARFLYYCVERGRLTHFILCQGQLAHLNGKPILAHNRKVERFEWLVREGLAQTFSSDELAKNSWSRNVSEWSD